MDERDCKALVDFIKNRSPEWLPIAIRTNKSDNGSRILVINNVTASFIVNPNIKPKRFIFTEIDDEDLKQIEEELLNAGYKQVRT